MKHIHRSPFINVLLAATLCLGPLPVCQGQQTAATGASSKSQVRSHPPKTEQLWLEAESGKISLPLRLGKDEAASGGQHIYMPVGKATYAFTIAKPGTYRVWGRVLATGGADNSFFISMDGGEKFKWNHNALKSTWQWEAVKNDKLKEVAQFKLAAGNHTLTVGYHEDGSRFDQLLITDDLQLNPAAQATSAATTLYLEAENGNVTPPMQVEEQAAASGGKYVWIPDQFSTYEFEVAEPGTYKVWGRVLAADGHADSFLVSIDEGQWVKWNDLPRGNAWVWDDVHAKTNTPENTVTFNLTAGKHTLKIKQREPGTQLDRLLITNDLSFKPSGAGRLAGN